MPEFHIFGFTINCQHLHDLRVIRKQNIQWIKVNGKTDLSLIARNRIGWRTNALWEGSTMASQVCPHTEVRQKSAQSDHHQKSFLFQEKFEMISKEISNSNIISKTITRYVFETGHVTFLTWLQFCTLVELFLYICLLH